jgi:NodT family efflux transporter outer membrane factor (OMF) lipoprotein
MRRLAAILMGGAALAACAVGPNFHRPAPPTVTRYTPEPLPPATASAPVPAGNAQQFVSGQQIAGQWWTLFHSPELDRLVAETLRANPDMAAARAALRSAHETYLASRGAFWPQADASYNYTRAKSSAALSPVLSTSNDLYSLHTAQVSVTYAPDVFGGVRRGVEAARAEEDQQRWQSEATYLALTSNLVVTAIAEASLRDQIAAQKRVVAEARQVLDITRRQRALGQLAGADVAAQEALLAQAEAALPPLEKQWAQARDLLADITGHAPSEAQADRLDLTTLTLPAELPVSLPSALVRQRPDVLAAEANLHVASAEVGVAIAARIPAFQLEADVGGAATSFAQMFADGNGFWTLAGSVTQPIFHGGELLHKQKAAEAALDQAKAQYRSTVLAALQNTADALQAVDADARALAAAAHAENAARRSLDIAKDQLAAGQISPPAVLLAEQAYDQAEIGLVQAEAARFSDTAALFQALGGGWWSRNDLFDARR